MGKQRILSSKFNMSLGYIPVIISIILCEFIIQDIAIYIGAGVGVLSSIYMWQTGGDSESGNGFSFKMCWMWQTGDGAKKDG